MNAVAGKIPMASADRVALIDSIKTQSAPLKELETVSIRPCCGDVIIAYKSIDGIGKPDNLAVNQSALWEQEALDAWQALQDAASAFQTWAEGYGFPDKPADAPAKQVIP
jgi:hypothetical protein